MRRYLELDALRGLMLVWITLTHMPTSLSPYVNQPLGYLSATEGFIFLSALFTGLIYGRLAERSGYPAVFRKLVERSWRLYGYQVLLLAFTFVLIARIASQGNRPAVHNLLDYYFTVGPIRAGFQALLLLYRPPLLDILPIYILLLFITPVVLWGASRLSWKAVLIGSGLLWLAAQFGLREAAYHVTVRLFGLTVPLPQMGAFDLWAWQLWWVLGLWLGARWARGEGLPLAGRIGAISPYAGGVVLALLALRSAEVFGAVELGRLAFLTDKWHLGILRIVDFAAVATVAIRFHSRLEGLALRPLVAMGQASLQVFCVHLLTVLVALALIGVAPVLTGWRVPAFIVASLLLQWLTAVMAGRNRSAKPVAPAPEKVIAVHGEWHKLEPAATQKAASLWIGFEEWAPTLTRCQLPTSSCPLVKAVEAHEASK